MHRGVRLDIGTLRDREIRSNGCRRLLIHLVCELVWGLIVVDSSRYFLSGERI